MYDFQTQIDKTIKDRAYAIETIQTAGAILAANNFFESTKISSSAASDYIDGGQLFKESSEKDARYLNKYQLPLFITGLVIFSVQLILIVVSMFVVACVLKT